MSSVILDDAIDKANPNRATMFVGCGICSIMCISLSFYIFLFGWSIAGWIWILEVWNKVQFKYENKDDYCHPLVYKFTLSVLLFKVIFEMTFFCLVCRKACPRIRRIRRRETVVHNET